MGDPYLSLSQDGVIKDIIHLAGRGGFLHLGPQPHAAFLKELNTHFMLEGNNWRKKCILTDSKLLLYVSCACFGVETQKL